MCNPTGPAGGDLAGNYPNPTVPGLVSLQSQIDAANAAIATINTALDTITTEIGELANDVSDNTSAIAALTTTVSGNTADIATLNAEMVTVSDALAALSATTTSLQDQVTANATAITDLAAVVAAIPIAVGGTGTLDGTGNYSLMGQHVSPFVVMGWFNAAGVGPLYYHAGSDSIQSVAEAADAGQTINWNAPS